jgi:hypothetical protein
MRNPKQRHKKNNPRTSAKPKGRGGRKNDHHGGPRASRGNRRGTVRRSAKRRNEGHATHPQEPTNPRRREARTQTTHHQAEQQAGTKEEDERTRTEDRPQSHKERHKQNEQHDEGRRKKERTQDTSQTAQTEEGSSTSATAQPPREQTHRRGAREA